jgi:hypothetical protein
MQQIYAKIKKSSKYFDQNRLAQEDPQRWGFPFPVHVVAGGVGGYVVQGGPGGQYRLTDVNLFVIDGDREMKIS